MVKLKETQTLEESLLLLREKGKTKNLSVAEIFQILSSKEKFLCLMLLSLPFCQPIQIPGLSTPFGLIISIVGFRLCLRKPFWLPQKLLLKTISPATLEKIINKALIVIKKIKRFVHPRLYWVCHSSFIEVANGLMISILGLLLALPLPIPFSNLTAAWSIFLIALGKLEEDGLLVLIGYLVSLITLAIFIILLFTAKQFYLSK